MSCAIQSSRKTEYVQDGTKLFRKSGTLQSAPIYDVHASTEMIGDHKLYNISIGIPL